MNRIEYAELGDDDFESRPALSDEARARMSLPDAPKLRVDPDNLLPIDWNEDPT